VQLIIAFFAVTAAGGVAVLLNAMWTTDELEYVLCIKIFTPVFSLVTSYTMLSLLTLGHSLTHSQFTLDHSLTHSLTLSFSVSLFTLFTISKSAGVRCTGIRRRTLSAPYLSPNLSLYVSSLVSLHALSC